MKNKHKWIVGISVAMAILLMIGWIMCLCKITTLNAECVQRFSTIIDIICSLGILLLTATNVWLAYTVSTIEEKHRKYQLQTEIINRFNSNIHTVFTYGLMAVQHVKFKLKISTLPMNGSNISKSMLICYPLWGRKIMRSSYRNSTNFVQNMQAMVLPRS